MRQKAGLTRRNFFKTSGILGIGSMVAGLISDPRKTTAAELTVPTRPFGKTGVQVSILSLGGMFDTIGNQLMLKQAVKWGVTYWDTANSYGGGRSEEGFGKYFARYPEDRKKIFLVTKSGAWSQSGTTRHLNLSLERMKTDYIDLFFVHAINRIEDVSGMKQWAEKAKSDGKIRFFGFSTHSNMEECLMDAASLGWVDGIMMTYNFRLMKTDRMRRAVDACVKSGIGLTAMKTQGGGSVRSDTEAEMDMAGRFLQKGFTDGQAKLKAVWNNNQISSICSQMPTVSLLMANVQAAAMTSPLSENDHHALDRYANATESDYCSGCTHLCEPVLDGSVPVGDIMRCLMYARSYGDPLRAKEEFRRISPEIQRRLCSVDYTRAEARCPRKIVIGKHMKAAIDELI
ncbi:MAG: aldo/keto reductase [Thermodesulfobacteriota bacterium]